ncbi:hypothetical protein [Spiroplasma endosymbiont of Polydrusus pterygomalis]|uniref:hypothetical protein n=1 Tax=Spiroplasma endosymbiont of Polydrusus pterygomalis TaxID=3139327 RepID=UPI003CCB1B2B
MITNEIAEKIVSIAFALSVIISAIGWLGIKKSKKSYIFLWIAIIPLIISAIFSFFTKDYYSNILLILILIISYLIYICFLSVNTYRFFKIKDNNQEIDNIIENKVT